MLVSAGVTENMVWSGENTDNVLLEWETAVMAGQKGICVPQPVFINEVSKTDAMHTVKGLDAVSAFIKSDKCPKVRPNLEDSHKWSADQTLREVKQLQGVNLDVNEVSWVIPDLIKALQTFLPLKMKNAALQCATEASFFKYFHPQINFDDTAYDISFLTSNDLKEVFGYKEEDKKSILEYREKLESLVLTFQTTPRVSTRSMRVLSEGLKKNYSFLQDLTLKVTGPYWLMHSKLMTKSITLTFVTMICQACMISMTPSVFAPT
ncbi:hypothetical protein BC830DRAFT_121825 [Chytriomyces sp. MP71]|nr:hypothetical protein BC830DRAFT_121825 [Chytriomyces sp. MP71]